MSFNNLAFNVSKSTPTTSTTNTNSVSSPNPSHHSFTPPKSPMVHGLPTKISPKIIPSTAVSAAPVVTYGSEQSKSVESNSNRKELIELFDKFDVADKSQKSPELQEDKFESFKHLRKDSFRSDDSGIVNEKELEYTPNETVERNTSELRGIVEAEESDPDNAFTAKQKEPQLSHDDNIETQPSQEIESTEPQEQPEEIPPENEPLDLQDSENKTDIPESEYDEADTSIEHIEEDENSPEEQFELTQEEINSHKEESAKRPDFRSRSLSQVAVNPDEQYQKSHRPFDFHVFLEHLKEKSAEPIVKYIRSFLVSFNRQGRTFSLQQKAKVVKDFKVFMSEKFMLFEPFSSMDEIDLENSREGLEKLIMNRIYGLCFSPELSKTSKQLLGLVAHDIEEDREFSNQLEKFSWISGHHLDVNLEKLTSLKAKTSEQELNFMEYAIKELAKINDYRAPRDKIICLLNGCKIIFGFLKVNKQETNADAFIPILILIIIRAKIPHLISNIHYIEHFRGLEWLHHGETSYYLSSIQGAISFIKDVGFDDLTIDKEEYDAHIEAWEASERIKRENEASQTIPIQNQPSEHPNSALSPSSVLMTSAEMFTKSISNFLSPSPQPDSPVAQTPQPAEDNTKLINDTCNQLREIFPDLDSGILRDIVIMNKGDMDQSLDACLQVLSS